MASSATDPIAEQHIARYREERRRAEQALNQIANGMTFHESPPDGPMQDVTLRRRSELEHQLALLDELIRLWEADLELHWGAGALVPPLSPDAGF
jgi:hypothetical protein